MRPDDLVPLLTKQPIPGVGFRQGTVLAWDAETADNVVAVGGAQVSNLTVLSASEVKVIQPGDQVSILTLGTGAKSWFVLGKVTVPGGAELAIVQSANFETGTSGYSINRDGTAEFLNLVARGDIGARSVTLPPNAGPGTPRLVLGPDLPPPLDTYLWSGSQLAVGGIIYRQGDVGDDNFTFLVMVVFPGQVLVHLGHVLNGVMQEITPGFPKGQAWSYNGFGVQTEIQTGGSEDTLTIGNRWTGNASGGDFTNLDIVANVRVGGGLGYTSSNPPPSVEVSGDLTVDGRIIPSYRATVTTDQVSTANNTTLFNVTALSRPVDANTVYRFKLYLLYTATTVADFKMALTGPSGADLSRWWFSCINAAGAAASGPAGAGGAVGMGASGTSTPAFFIGDGTIAIGGTAGTVQVQAAKNTAEASTLTIRKGSYLELEPLT